MMYGVKEVNKMSDQLTYVTGTAEVRRRDYPEDISQLPSKRSACYDGKCTCCPYGYHIDLDFVNYCETMNNGGTLQNLRRIQRTKRKLRKSMEMMLQTQDNNYNEVSTPPPDVVHSTEASRLLNMIEYEQTATNHVLETIDTTVDKRIRQIMTTTQHHGQHHQKNHQQQHYSTDSETDDIMYNDRAYYTQNFSGGEDSRDTVDSYNSFTRHNRVGSFGSLSTMSNASNEIQGQTLHSMQVTGMLADAAPQPVYQTFTSAQLAATIESHMPTTEVVTTEDKILISRSSLKAIREAVAQSLKQMKDLEEQLKAIPILQVRISVLKEEKRLLTLQAQANAKKFNQYTSSATAMSEYKLDSDYEKMTSSPRSFNFHISPRSVSPTSSTSYISHHDYGHHSENLARKVMTRSIGVGDSNTQDNSGVQIHEKELRTVIIGGNQSVAKRNVGIDCRVSTRDVGIMYSCDEEKPSTRTVGINVDTGTLLTSLSFKREELSSALRSVLHHSVRSIGINCNFKPEMISVGTNKTSVSTSVGCGDDRIDVEIKNPTVKKSVGISAYPAISNRSSNTDYGWRIDSGTNTPVVDKRSKSTTTDRSRLMNSSTNTDQPSRRHEKIQTDQKMFKSTTKSTGSNTVANSVHSVAINTEQKALSEENFDVDVSFYDKVDSVEDKVYDDEERKEDYTETITKTSYIQQVPETTNHGDQSYQSSSYRLSSIPISQRTQYSSSSLPGGSSSASSSSSLSSRYLTDSSNLVSTVPETDYDENTSTTTTTTRYITEEVPTTTIIREYDINRGQLSSQNVESFSTTFSDYSKPAIKTNPNPFDYGDAFSSHRLLKKRQPLHTEYATKVWTGDKFEFKDNVEMGPMRDITEEDVEQAEGYMRFLKRDANGKVIHETEQDDDGEWETISEVITTSTESNSGNQSGGNFRNEMESSSGMQSSGLSGSLMNEMESSSGMQSSGLRGSLRNEMESSSGMQISGKRGSFRNEMESSSGSQSSSLRGSYMNEMETSADSGYSRYSTNEDDGKFESLRSCLKQNKMDNRSKRGITFADTVVGGTGNSSNDSGSGSDSDSASYDEGSYDSRHGQISYSCQEDQMVTSGFQMFDQNIRETYDLTGELRQSCETLSTYLQDSTTVKTEQLNSACAIIKKEWFKTINNKFVNSYEVEDYMSSFNEISNSLLKYIVNMCDDNGNTAIHYAVSNCNYEVVSLLMDTEAVDIDKPNKAGYTPIMLAALTNNLTAEHRQVVFSLFSRGNINAKASQAGQTALMLAVSHGRTNMVRLLLDSGADINERDFDGSTALMCACEHGHTDIVKMLLGQPDCDANLRDNDGSTALEIAMEAGFKDIGVILYAHLNFAKPLSPGILKGRKTSN